MSLATRIRDVALRRLGMEVLPHRWDGYLRIYPTLLCNLRCPYCVNHLGPGPWSGHRYRPITSAQWLDIIRKIGRTVIVSGGEPSLYPEFLELLSGIPPRIEVRVYTNMTFDAEALVRRVERPIGFLGSIHPCAGDLDRVIRCIRALSAHPRFSVTHHVVDAPESRAAVPGLCDAMRKAGLSPVVAEDQRPLFPRALRKERRPVICANRAILVAPDGRRYPCGGRMMSMRGGLEDLTREPLGPERPAVRCADWGHCAPCDGLLDSRVRFLARGQDGAARTEDCEASVTRIVAG